MPQFDFEGGFQCLDEAMTSGSRTVPFIAQMHEFAMASTGTRGDLFYSDADAFVRGTCETARAYGFDTPSFIWDAYNVEAEALGVKLVLFEDMAPALDNVEPLIRNESDLAGLRSPDPANAGRMPFVAETLHLIKEYTGRRQSLVFCAPFTMAAHLMTFENLIVQIKQNPAFVHKVMDFIVDEVLVPYFHHMHRQFPDLPGFDGSDATASLPFITQEMQEEFALGPIERLQRQVELPCYVDNWWGDSYTDDKERFWHNKLRATPAYFKLQDPDLWKVGLAEPMAFAARQDKPVVLGIDNNLFQNGPAEAIEQRVHEYMEAIEAHQGKGVVYFCSLSAVTPPEHVRVAIEAVEKFRKGDRPWAGLRRAGTAEARGETGGDKRAEKAPKAAASHGVDEANEECLDAIYAAVMDYDDQACANLVRQAINDGLDVYRILDDALIAAMDEIGALFSDGVVFVPEMLMAARAMKAGLEVIRPILTQTGAPPRGCVMLATVQGDVHDIGKNLVGMMLEGAGYQVVDLGVNKTKEEILAEAESLRPDVVGLSALLTTSMPSMAKAVAAFKEQGLPYPVIVGGAPVTEVFAETIGADGYGEDAPGAVALVNAFVEKTPTRLEEVA